MSKKAKTATDRGDRCSWHGQEEQVLMDKRALEDCGGNMLAAEFGQEVTYPGSAVKGNEPEPLMKIDEAAALLNITRARAYALARMRLLPVVSLGRQKRVSRAALERFIADGGKALP